MPPATPEPQQEEEVLLLRLRAPDMELLDYELQHNVIKLDQLRVKVDSLMRERTNLRLAEDAQDSVGNVYFSLVQDLTDWQFFLGALVVVKRVLRGAQRVHLR